MKYDEVGLDSPKVKVVEILNKPSCVLGLKLLSKNVIREAVFATEDIFRSINRKVAEGVSENQLYIEYHGELRCQILYRATIDPDDQKPYFKSPDQIGNTLLRPQIDDLFEKYSTFQDEVCPTLDVMPEDEFLALKKKLFIHSEAEIGKISNLPIAKRLLFSLVNDIKTSST